MFSAKRIIALGLVSGLLATFGAQASASPASYQCLRSEAIRTLEGAGRYNPDVTVECSRDKPIYRVHAWTHRQFQGSTIVREERIRHSGPGTYFNDNALRMCGNPCR